MRGLSQTGTTLVEIMVGILILAMGLVLVLTTLGTSLRVQSLGANTLIAMNIAREGLEAVRNIRDTNWLVNAGNKRQCWNYSRSELGGTADGKPFGDGLVTTYTMADKIKAATCVLFPPFDPNDDINRNPIRSGYYTVVQDLNHTMAWTLENFLPLEGGLNELGGANYSITSYPGLTSGVEEDSNHLYPYTLYRVVPDDGSRPLSSQYPYIYTHRSRELQENDSLTLQPPRPLYFRQIRIRYLCDEPTFDGGLQTIVEMEPLISAPNPFEHYPNDSLTDCATLDENGQSYPRTGRDDNRMEVTSIVQWFESGRVQEVRLMMHLTDWLEREGHDA